MIDHQKAWLLLFYRFDIAPHGPDAETRLLVRLAMEQPEFTVCEKPEAHVHWLRDDAILDELNRAHREAVIAGTKHPNLTRDVFDKMERPLVVDGGVVVRAGSDLSLEGAARAVLSERRLSEPSVQALCADIKKAMDKQHRHPEKGESGKVIIGPDQHLPERTAWHRRPKKSVAAAALAVVKKHESEWWMKGVGSQIDRRENKSNKTPLERAATSLEKDYNRRKRGGDPPLPAALQFLSLQYRMRAALKKLPRSDNWRPRTEAEAVGVWAIDWRRYWGR